MKRCKYITCWTDYPFNNEPSRIRHVQVLCYDGDKYATVTDLQTGEIEHVKRGYLYSKPERLRILLDLDEYIRRLRSKQRPRLHWVYMPKSINRRKLERMISHCVD